MGGVLYKTVQQQEQERRLEVLLQRQKAFSKSYQSENDFFDKEAAHYKYHNMKYGDFVPDRYKPKYAFVHDEEKREHDRHLQKIKTEITKIQAKLEKN